jgi:hypothetical protein
MNYSNQKLFNKNGVIFGTLLKTISGHTACFFHLSVALPVENKVVGGRRPLDGAGADLMNQFRPEFTDKTYKGFNLNL